MNSSLEVDRDLTLKNTLSALIANDRGLLAIDESNPTCNKRFAAIGIPQTTEMRREYRNLLISTPRLSDSISGVILFKETFLQKENDGSLSREALTNAGLIAGIKVDIGAKAMALFPGERVTEGLDGLRSRMISYASSGARFAKWRAVISVGESTPSSACVEVNASALARYAALCQECALIPIIEPEVSMIGAHSIERCQDVTEHVLRTVFDRLNDQTVRLEFLILKTNMILPGLKSSQNPSPQQIAEITIESLRRIVPAAVPAVAFLSGGQEPVLATERLNAMNSKENRMRSPWALTFSFARAIQGPALAIWKGHAANKDAAQKALLHRAICNRAARKGEYLSSMEMTAHT